MNGSNYGPPIPIVYGLNKTSGNCCWYGDFTAVQVQGGGKGGGGTQGVSYNYSSSYMFAVCEGPIAGFEYVWEGSSFQTLSELDPAFTATGTSSQTPWSHFSGTEALGYRYTALVAFLMENLGGSANTPNYQFEVQGFGGFNPPTIPDANPSWVLNDICTDPNHGMGFNFLGDLSQYSNYCVANGLFLSPVYNEEQNAAQTLSNLLSWTNSAAYWSEGEFKIVPYGDVAVTGNGVTFTPNLTVQHTFADADFIIEEGHPPVEVSRKAAADALNTVRVAYSDRNYYYYTMMAEAKDEEDALATGLRSVQSVNIPACTQNTVARFIAQNLLQRIFYIRNTYKWKASWRWAALEPTDVVALTDTTLGLNGALVRITSVEEDETGQLSFEAEELPIGVGHSSAYTPPSNSGYLIDINVDPDEVVEPLFFRYPAFLPGVDQATPKIGIAVTATSPNWGSCQIFASYDGTDYFYVTTTSLHARYGLLGSDGLHSGDDPDTVNIPQVTLETGQLQGGTQADADNLITLAMVDTEVISYKTATLVSGTTYNLSYLRRGCYNNPIITHAAYAPFVRLDSRIVTFPFDPSQVGKTVYFKFLSFNIFSKTPRTLASETAYSYVIGASPSLPDVPVVPASFTLSSAPNGVLLSWSNVNPVAVAITSIERSPDGSTWSVIAQVGNAHTSYLDVWTQAQLVTNTPLYYRARALGSLPQAGFSAYTSTLNSAVSSVGLSPNAVTIAAGGIVPNFSSYGRNLIPNALFSSNRVGVPFNTGFTAIGNPLCDNWAISSGSFGMSATFSASLSNTYVSTLGNTINISAGNGFSIPAGATYIARIATPQQIQVHVGDLVTAGGRFYWNHNYAIPSGMTINVTYGIYFFNAAGSYTGQVTAGVSNAQGHNSLTTGAPDSATGTVPANTAYGIGWIDVDIINTTGSTITIPTGNNYLLVGYFQDIFTWANDVTAPGQGSGQIHETGANQFHRGSVNLVLDPNCTLSQDNTAQLFWNVKNGATMTTSGGPNSAPSLRLVTYTSGNEVASEQIIHPCKNGDVFFAGCVVKVGASGYAGNFDIGINMYDASGNFLASVTVAIPATSLPTAWGTQAVNVFVRVNNANCAGVSWRADVSSTFTTAGATLDMVGIFLSSQPYAVGSTPTSIPSAAFTYTSTTGSIVWAWVSMSIFTPDGASTTIANGSETNTGLTDSTTYYWYPKYDQGLNSLGGASVSGAVGSIPSLYTAKSTAAAQAQNALQCIPLSSGGIPAVTGSGGHGGGGGSGCLHPNQTLIANGKLMYAEDLCAGDRLRTLDGERAILKVLRRAQAEWIRVTFDNDDVITVTPSHRFYDPMGELVEASDLMLKSILQGYDRILVVVGLEYRDEATACVALDVEGGQYIAAGVLNKNGTVKP
ncbi:MAG: phage tail protein [Ktedonobacteraceae bacterium]